MPETGQASEAEAASFGAAAGSAPRFSLKAYRLGPERLRMIPAPADRSWMDATESGWANRCLPLRVANQAGWLILNECDIEVVWNGTNHTEAVQVTFLDPKGSRLVNGHFGYGIVTWSIPYLFRTPPGWNLLARGPANWIKDGACPLEGLVETDWSPATFTMNWRITRPFCRVRFYKDEPICMIVPQRRGELEAFDPRLWNVESEPEIRREWETWRSSRWSFLGEKKQNELDPMAWQRHYMRGTSPGEARAPEHQVKLKLEPFAEHEKPLHEIEDANPQRWSMASVNRLEPAQPVGRWLTLKELWKAAGSRSSAGRAKEPARGKNS